jgi:hypothetical protein
MFIPQHTTHVGWNYFKQVYMKWWENNEVSKHIKVNYLHHYGSHRKKDN